MKRHVMSIAYEPKIEAVRSGECLQTIRKGKRFAVGDSIFLHGWTDPKKPYRCKWNNRMRATVTRVIPIDISHSGLLIEGVFFSWDTSYADELAQLDFIDPPTGIELRDVLFKLNEAPTEPERYQVVIWEVTDWNA